MALEASEGKKMKPEFEDLILAMLNAGNGNLIMVSEDKDIKAFMRGWADGVREREGRQKIWKPQGF